MKNALKKLAFLTLVVFCILPAHSAQFRSGGITAGGVKEGSGVIKFIRLGSLGFSIRPVVRVSAEAGARALSRFAPSLNGEFVLGEVYAYPNPAKGAQDPAIHVEVGLADSVSFRIYDVTGALVHKAEVTAAPHIINDGQGEQYAYEYRWENDMASGTYICVVQAKKQGKNDIVAKTKIAVVK